MIFRFGAKMFHRILFYPLIVMSVLFLALKGSRFCTGTTNKAAIFPRVEKIAAS